MENIQKVEVVFQRKRITAVVAPGGGLVDIQQKANEWSTTSVRSQYKIEDQHRILQLAYKKIPKAVLQRTPAPPGLVDAPSLADIEAQLIESGLPATTVDRIINMVRLYGAAVRRAAGGF